MECSWQVQRCTYCNIVSYELVTLFKPTPYSWAFWSSIHYLIAILTTIFRYNKNSYIFLSCGLNIELSCFIFTVTLSCRYYCYPQFRQMRKLSLREIKQCNLRLPTIKSWSSLAPVAQACNPSYSGGRDQDDCGLKLAWENCLWDLMLKKKNHHNKRAGGVAEGDGPEFKPQCHQK
jgi:hypothetical protein